MVVEFQPGPFELEQSLRDLQYLEKRAPSRESFVIDLDRMRVSKADRDLAMTAFDYGASLDYIERGSVAGGYFMHPVRVARLLAGFRDKVDGSTIVCALLHNTLETAHVNTDALARVAGLEVLAKIQALTIDRQRQPDRNYLKIYYSGIRSAGVGDVKVVDKMKEMPTDDKLFGKGSIRVDGRKIHDAYLFEVKKPAESKGPWDYYKLRATIPAAEAFRPLAQSECPLVKK
jgi:hypothetical protein